MPDDMTTHDWFCRMANGQIVCGKTVGSFANIKGLEMSELWVVYGHKRYAAPVIGDKKPQSFDFYVSMAMEPDGVQAKAYKLVTVYPEGKLTRMVYQDGSTHVRQEIKR